MGSAVQARRAKAPGETIAGMLSLETMLAIIGGLKAARCIGSR